MLTVKKPTVGVGIVDGFRFCAYSTGRRSLIRSWPVESKPFLLSGSLGDSVLLFLVSVFFFVVSADVLEAAVGCGAGLGVGGLE